MKHRIFINNAAEWEILKKESLGIKEIIIFKFSPICAQSLDVQQEINAWYDTIINEEFIVLAFLNVISSRELSQSIAVETGIKHESPQVIWFNTSGEVKFSASHRKINAESLTKTYLIK